MTLGAGFITSGGGFNEDDGCVPMGNRIRGPWAAVEGKGAVLCTGEVANVYKGELGLVCPHEAIAAEEKRNRFVQDTLYDVEVIAENYVFTINVDKKFIMTVADDRLKFGSVGLQSWKMSVKAHGLQLLNSRGMPLMTSYVGTAEFSSAYEMYIDGKRAYSGEGAADGAIKLRFDGATNMIAVKLRLESTIMAEEDAVILEYQDMSRLSSAQHAYPAYVNYLLGHFPDSLVGNSVDTVDAFTNIVSTDDDGHLITRNLIWKFMATFCEDKGQEWEFKVGVDFGKGGQMFVDDKLVVVNYGDANWHESWSSRDEEFLIGKLFLGPGKHSLAVFGMETCCGGPSTFSFRRPGTDDGWLEFSRENLMAICETQGFEKFVVAAQTTDVEGCSHAGVECQQAIEDLQLSFPDMGYQELGVLAERGLTEDNYLTDTSVQQYLFDFEAYTDCKRPCIDLLPKMVTGFTPEGMEGWRCLRTNELQRPEADGTAWTEIGYDHSDWEQPAELDDYVETLLLAHTDTVRPKWVGVEDSNTEHSGQTTFVGCVNADALEGVTLVKAWADNPFQRAHATEHCRSECGLEDYFSIGRVEVIYTDDEGEEATKIEINCYCVEAYDMELQLTAQAADERDDTLCGESLEVGGLGVGTCSSEENLAAFEGPQWCVDGAIDASIGVFRVSYDTTYCVYSFEVAPEEEE